MSVIIWSEKNIKSKINVGEKLCAVENVKYPYFEAENKNEYKKLCSAMNRFYGSAAQKYSAYIRTVLPKRFSREKKTMTVGMKYAVTFADESIISVVLDLYLGDGERIKMKRFSQMWSLKTETLIPVYELVHTNGGSCKKLLSKIFSCAAENFKIPSMGYYDDYRKRLKRAVRISNCFAVPNGIAFFVQPGEIRPEKYGSSVFVLPYESLDGIIKEKFWAENVIKSRQKGNIVNNI